MTSIVGHVPNLASGEALPAWMKLDWNEKVQHDIFRDWGTYYSNRQRENFAQYYFTEALKLNEDDFTTLYRRSLARSRAAKIDESLSDARQAADMAIPTRGFSCPINLQICDALFELNKFETCYSELFINIERFMGVKAKNFETRRIFVENIIKDVTGKALSLFYLRNQKLVKHVSALIKAEETIDDRPMWKILKDLEKCDILSIPDKEVELLSPLEEARRKRAFNVIHQNYCNCSWIDVLFMKELRKNPNLLLDYCKGSRNFLETLSRRQYDVVRRFIKMIHCRSPLYYVNFMKFSNKKLLEKNKEAYLYRVQYQTHRNMIANLRVIRKLRKEAKVKQLAQYVEQIMGDLYVTKTHRVMCWKFEFYNEVYNTLALAIAEQYYLPKKYKIAKMSLVGLLRVTTEKLKEAPLFVFGDRSTYQDGDAQDPVAIKARQMLNRLDRRMIFAKYSIEKCYLLHQIASVHLSQLHYDECCFNARKAIKESQNCNSNLWKFLSILQIVKANELQHKVERTKDAVEEALPVAIKLNSPQLISFIELCQYFVIDQFQKKAFSIASQQSSRGSESVLL